ncbi:unnamed protein product [Blumeria hordei]|uniref:Uncharacterized protein n=1 Tax=Blumeria hordei TaxID=2867405 RepID=A0A383UZ69_BLUHO|nr:unnamed protein product [Blumeria hordei]
MGKPRMIILIRHAQSEGNKNRDIHQTIPDHRVKLTPEGWTQAYDAGRRLRSLLRADDTLHFFISPYRRTRETTEGILSTLTTDEPSPSPFPRNSIKIYEEPKLREQDFGNFQPCSAEMERMWQERADYGHFFYRIPNGESAADAYDRVSGFNESLWRQFGEEDFASVCVLVTHGLMSRIFLMKWYHFSVEYFEDLRNVNHCEFLIMRKREDSGKYILENNLRTWSELKRERMEAAQENSASSQPSTRTPEKDREIKVLASLNALAVGQSTPTLARKKWGGCPNGCDHAKFSYKKENSMHAMQLNGRATPNPEEIALQSRRPLRRNQPNTEEDLIARARLTVKVDKSDDDNISSPDGTPSFISVEDRMLHILKSPRINHLQAQNGIKFYSNMSASTSQTGSDDCDFSAEEDATRGKGRIFQRNKLIGPCHGHKKVNVRGRGAITSALSDQSDIGTDDVGLTEGKTDDMDDLEKAEANDKSLIGSVY